MRTLVTGGAGFLGSHLIDRLLLSGHSVICVDNLFSGDKKNLIQNISHENFEFIRHDITFPLYLEVDQIFNLACPASPVQYQKDPVQTIKTNVHGSINVLGLAKRTKARIFQASTSEIYGDPEVHPQNEEYWGKVNPIGIRSCYDEGKRAAETLFFDYYRQYNVNVRVARLFNTYGPRMQLNDGRVISNLIVQAITGKDLTIYGTGEHTRSFCYIDDMINGIIEFMNNDIDFVGPLNLGNSIEISINEIAMKIIDLTNSKSKLVYKPLPEDDPKRRKPDLKLAKKTLNWEAKIDIDTGLRKTIDYFEKVLTKSK